MKIQGLPVVDGTRKVSIYITAKDIAKANRKNPAACAAAQACLRVPNCSQARVHMGRSYLLIGKKWQRLSTPAALRTEIVSFDRGAPFQPGHYTLVALSPSATITGRRQGSDKIKKTRKEKVRAKPHVIVGVRANGAQDCKRG